MGLCTNEIKKKRPFKTIIVPRGIINPNEDNIIEIPLNLNTASSLIVRAPSDVNSCFFAEPYHGDLANIPPAVPPTSTQMYSVPSQMTSYATVESDFNPQTKADFCCQTEPPCLSRPLMPPCAAPYPPCASVPQSTNIETCVQPIKSIHLQQSPFHSTNISPSFHTQDAHSPLCPICSKASCKYLSSSGVNRRYSNNFNQFSSPLCPGQTDTYFNTAYPIYGNTYDNDFRLPSVIRERCEIVPQLKDKKENEMLNKLLEEKIDKVLKPILFSLAKLTPEDEENEICAAKYSCTSIQPRCSREQCYLRKGNWDSYRDSEGSRKSKMKTTSSYGPTASVESSNFEDFQRCLKMKDRENYNIDSRRNTRNFAERSLTKPYSTALSTDYEYAGRRSPDPDREYDHSRCPTTASCQRRTNVSFRDKTRKNFISSGTDDGEIINKDAGSSNYSLTPRSSF